MDHVVRSLYGSAAAHARGDMQAVHVLLDPPSEDLGVDHVVVIGVGALVEILDDVARTRGVPCAEYAHQLLSAMTRTESAAWSLLAMVCAASEDDLIRVASGLDVVCADPDAIDDLAGMLALFLSWQANDRDVSVAEWIQVNCHAAAVLDDAA